MTNTVEEPKVMTGMQSAVRYGFTTPEEALNQTALWEADGNYVRSSLIRWLKNRSKK